MAVSFLTSLDDMREALNGTSCREARSKIGQFLTPAAIAEFMASLFERNTDNVRILDPGAGAGVLFAACVEALIARKQLPDSIKVVAYETDECVRSFLKDTMRRCEKACEEAEISFRGEIRPEDFISAGMAKSEEGLFAEKPEHFTHAILNPPYKKINGRSETRKLLGTAGLEVSNLYAAFVWLAMRMLEPGGELVAITPRSFCNGPYFRRFRVALLDMLSVRRIHVFESRKKAFGEDGVLQENVIFRGVRGSRRNQRVVISSSESADFKQSSIRSVPYDHMVLPDDPDAFIHLVLNEADDLVMERMRSYETTLDELRLEVSTGRVVDFRARAHLRSQPEAGAAPLIYPCHFQNGFVHWPVDGAKKPNAIASSEHTRDLMVAEGYYVLTKRFTTKEEQRRVVAAVYDPRRIEAPLVGFENHLNYFHARGAGLPANLAKGLALYLNSSLFDRYFRLFSGHTQVNATDLRKMRYPSRSQLLRLGSHVKQQMPDPKTIDAALIKECEHHEQ